MPSIHVTAPGAKGFTLLEMSVVLLIIGLIASAVVVGKTMVRQSQLMSVTTDVQKFVSAAKIFQQKYGALPGDFSNAQSYWGTNPNCSSYGAGTGTQTCNGNGDGQVGNKSSGTAARNFETLLFWQHLDNAGLLAGGYTGSSSNATTGYYSIPGVNVPASAIDGAGYSFLFVGNLPTDGCCSLSGWFAGNYGHVIELGAQDTGTSYETWYPVLTGAEAQSLDSKIDDGLPGTGSVMSQDLAATPNCVSSNSHTTAAYSASGASAACGLIFITGM